MTRKKNDKSSATFLKLFSLCYIILFENTENNDLKPGIGLSPGYLLQRQLNMQEYMKFKIYTVKAKDGKYG